VQLWPNADFGAPQPLILLAASNKLPSLNVNQFLCLRKQLQAITETSFPCLSPAMVPLLSYSWTLAKIAAGSYYLGLNSLLLVYLQ
jgi:hypothetical protein